MQHTHCIPGTLPRVTNIKTLWWQYGKGEQINLVNIRDKSVPPRGNRTGKSSAARSPSTAILFQDLRRPKEKDKEVRDFVMLDVNPHGGGVRSSDGEDEEAEFCESLMRKIFN